LQRLNQLVQFQIVIEVGRRGEVLLEGRVG
jgi:hypothetical protein